MTRRRFINLMMKDLRVAGSYWLSRMRPEKNLFYASVEEAVASKKCMPLCLSSGELSSPEHRFKSSLALDSRLRFMPFYGVGGGEGRIIVSDSAGQTHVYDADKVSVEIIPTNDSPNWLNPISVYIAKDDIRAEALYSIDRLNSTNFKSLAYPKDNKSGWDWLQLPPPPYILGDQDSTINSYTLLEDNRTICFSSLPEAGFGTYCFDTVSLEWTKAGSWTLPFFRRALCVPQLYSLYFGFHDSNQESLVAVELPSPLDGDALPMVLHEWGGFGQPEPDQMREWSLTASRLLYLGNHRFCAARFFALYDNSQDLISDMAAVFTGVEIVNGQANKDKLQMIKHKTITYIFEECSIEDVF